MTTRIWLSTLAAGVGLGAALAGPALATSFRSTATELRGQLQASALVFEGQIDSVYACPDPESKFPRTCGRVSISRTFKGGTSSGKVILMIPGGTLPDGRSVVVSGAPALQQGETVLVSSTVKPASQDTVALTNFDTALLRRSPGAEGTALVTDARGRVLADWPLDGRARFTPKPYGVGPAGPTEADSATGGPNVPEPALAPMTWRQVEDTVTAGLAAIADTQSSSTPATTIVGAR